MGESLSAGDILAMTNNSGKGFLEGNGIIILLLFLLFLGGGFGGFGGNNASTQGALTRAELQDGLNAQNNLNAFNSLNMGLANNFANLNMNMNNGFNGVAMGMTNGFNSVNQNLNNLGFQMQQCCCDLKTTIANEGSETRQLIQSNLIDQLNQKIADKDRELQSAIFASSQLTQTRTLEDFILANKSTT